TGLSGTERLDPFLPLAIRHLVSLGRKKVEVPIHGEMQDSRLRCVARNCVNNLRALPACGNGGLALLSGGAIPSGLDLVSSRLNLRGIAAQPGIAGSVAEHPELMIRRIRVRLSRLYKFTEINHVTTITVTRSKSKSGTKKAPRAQPIKATHGATVIHNPTTALQGTQGRGE